MIEGFLYHCQIGQTSAEYCVCGEHNGKMDSALAEICALRKLGARRIKKWLSTLFISLVLSHSDSRCFSRNRIQSSANNRFRHLNQSHGHLLSSSKFI